jgi:hypothetical protein
LKLITFRKIFLKHVVLSCESLNYQIQCLYEQCTDRKLNSDICYGTSRGSCLSIYRLESEIFHWQELQLTESICLKYGGLFVCLILTLLQFYIRFCILIHLSILHSVDYSAGLDLFWFLFSVSSITLFT